MATIALYANKINQMPELIKDIKQSVIDYKSELSALKSKTLTINSSACDLDDVISSIQSSTQTQEDKVTSLDTFIQGCEEFITDVQRIDEDVADIIRQRKDDFYEAYYYLKPEYEKNGWEKFCDGCKKVGEWCKEHWKEILITVVIVIGAVLAVAAVICSGGLALVPILAAGLTSLGISAGTAMTIATVTSLVVSVIAVGSTLASSTLNIIDTWCDMSNNSTFKSWQNAMNWISAISNGIYSIGSIYNGFKGITNESLRNYGKAWFSDKGFRRAIINADKFNFSLKPDSSVFWTGMRDNGAEHVAKNYVERYGGASLETTLREQGFSRFSTADGVINLDWRGASTSFAMRSSGEIKALIGSSPWNGSIWNTTEKILLNINPKITGIKEIYGVTTQFTARVFEVKSFLSGMGPACESLISLFSIYE